MSNCKIVPQVHAALNITGAVGYYLVLLHYITHILWRGQRVSKKNKRSWLENLYIGIRTWFQPYYRPKPKKKKRDDTKAKGGSTAATKVTAPKVTQAKKTPVPAPGEQPAVRIVDYPKPLDKVAQFKSKPGLNRIWCYHDATRHQVAAHLGPGMGYKFRERDDAARKTLKPSVFPIDHAGPFDRTHLIPIGYHGSESDHRLLIGWSPEANRGPFNDFEQVQKARKYPILWVVSVIKTHTGAEWTYTVYKYETMEKVDELKHTMVGEFAWKA